MRRLALLVCALVLAGCASDPGTQSVGDAAPAAAPATPGGELPPGCGLDRAAFVHGADGAPATPAPGATLGVGCMSVTRWGTGEPSLGLTGKGTLFLYPAFQAPTESTSAAAQFTGMGIAVSADQGASFERHRSEVGGVVNFHPYTADPFMYVDPYTDRVFMEDLVVPPFNCANLSYSDDDGQTWTQTLGGCLVWDHVGYGSGPPTVSQTRGYPVVVQRCAITLVATTIASYASGCQKSLDGGATWEAPGDPAFLFGNDGQPYLPSTCFGAVHHVFVDFRGWTWLGRGWCGNNGRNDPYVALSKDEGATWQRIRIHDGPIAGHDVGLGVDPAGNAYAMWIDGEAQVPVLSVSTDDGQTWSEPMRVAPDDVAVAGAFSLAPGGVGKAALSYVAVLASDPLNSHAVMAAAYGLDTDAPAIHTAVLTTPHEPLQAGGSCADAFCSGQADFLDATIAPDGTAWGSFVHGPNLAGGHLWGAPSLWDESDPDGVYGGWLA